MKTAYRSALVQLLGAVTVTLVSLAAGAPACAADRAAPGPTTRPRAAVVAGYPAPDLPMYVFVFNRQGVRADTFPQVWLPLEQFSRYSTVVLTGSFSRAQMEPKQFKAEDLPKIQEFVESGGNLLLGMGSISAFSSPEAWAYFQNLTGSGRSERKPLITLRAPDQAWVKPLAQLKDISWLISAGTPLRMTKAEQILGNEAGDVILARQRVGRGQIIYIGWSFSLFLPAGRNLKSTLEDEEKYEAQFKVLMNIAEELYPARRAGTTN